MRKKISKRKEIKKVFLTKIPIFKAKINKKKYSQLNQVKENQKTKRFSVNQVKTLNRQQKK